MNRATVLACYAVQYYKSFGYLIVQKSEVCLNARDIIKVVCLYVVNKLDKLLFLKLFLKIKRREVIDWYKKLY